MEGDIKVSRKLIFSSIHGRLLKYLYYPCEALIHIAEHEVIHQHHFDWIIKVIAQNKKDHQYWYRNLVMSKVIQA